jgi:hypothetical protein
VLGTASPALETAIVPHNRPAKIKLGLLSSLSTQPLPAAAKEFGLRLVLGGGDSNPGCRGPRILQYDMICDKAAASSAAPNIYEQPPRRVDPIPICTYRVVWRTPHACPVRQDVLQRMY